MNEKLAAALAGRYSIERELGGGGMSRVFVATETELGRTIVIKVVASELAGEVSAERFAREVRLAARLQQANIVPVLSAGDAAGLPYYTMPFVRGESLRARIARGDGMQVTEAVGILRDIARALSYAHAEGVVHRDIKPENILLSSGTAVVTDFGIAKALSASRTMDGTAGPSTTITQAGSSIGTPAYMAPEQAAGDPATDHRADIYAWGVIAWELIAGRHPFSDKTTPATLIAAHFAEKPELLTIAKPGVQAELNDLVARCLAKDPAQRPQSASELLGALDSLSTPQSVAFAHSTRDRPDGEVKRGWKSSHRRAAAAVVLLGLTGVVAYAARYRNAIAPGGEPIRAEADTVLSSLAVLPFVNTSGDVHDEYFSDGMTDELAQALSKLPGLRLAGRSSSFAYKGKSVPAREVGNTLGVGAIIEGTVRRSGDKLRVTAQLTSTRDGRVVWSDAFERAGTDVFEVQDEFTNAIVGALHPLLSSRLSRSADVTTDFRGTRDSRAYDLYLRGRYFWAQRGAGPLDSAVSLFEQAVERDPKFARGWAALALAHVMRPNYNAAVPALPAFRNGDAAASKALAIDSTIADAHSAIGMTRLRQWNLRSAGDAFAAARRLEPANATAHHWSALYYNVTGDTANADREIGIALSLDPLSATTVNSQATMLSDRRRFSEALNDFARSIEISPAFYLTGSSSSRALIWSGHTDSALKVARARSKVSALRGRLGGMVLAAAAAGDFAEARRTYDVIKRGNDSSILLADRAMAELVLGDRARAAQLFVRSFETEGVIVNVFFSLCDPMLDRIREESAYIAFLKRHDLRDCDRRSPWPVKDPPQG